ncbi:MAG: hypothetical protein AAGA67_07180 [Cyanobacteria bacterium P01_F01_bin.153]
MLGKFLRENSWGRSPWRVELSKSQFTPLSRFVTMVVQKFSLKSFGEYLGHTLKQHYLKQYYPQFPEEDFNLLENLNPSEKSDPSRNPLENLPGIGLGNPLQISATIQVCVTESQAHLWGFEGATHLNRPYLLHHSKLSPEQARRLRSAIGSAPRGTQAVIERLGRLDFGPLVRTLWACHGDNGQDGWSRSRLYGAIQSYANFLLDVALQPGMSFSATSGDMDEVWHCHILQTQKYTNDCNTLFGYYLHHEAMSAPVQSLGKEEIVVYCDRPSTEANTSQHGTNKYGASKKSPWGNVGNRASDDFHSRRSSVVRGTGICRTDISDLTAVRAA